MQGGGPPLTPLPSHPKEKIGTFGTDGFLIFQSLPTLRTLWLGLCGHFLCLLALGTPWPTVMQPISMSHRFIN